MKILSWVVLLIMVFSWGALAEETGETSPENERIDQLEKKLAELQAQVEAQDDNFSGEDLSIEEAENQRSLDLYGFFDVTYGQSFYEKGAPFGATFSDRTSFFISSINLYLDSKISRTLKALAELRFTFSPLGKVTQYEIVGDPTSETIRVDTEYESPMTMEKFRLGGVGIERVFLTYAYRDWFNIKAGRFLTPYGIWNINHGSTVIIPILVPYLVRAELVPRAQTGINLFGRYFFCDELSFDYAFTVSNGRGPIESVVDLDDNKGLGLRLRMTYDNNNLQVALGGYGYYGTYTDSKKVYTLAVGSDGKIAPGADMPLMVNDVKLTEYDEYIITADLSIQLWGVKLQSEYVWRRVEHAIPTQPEPIEKLLSGGSVFDSTYYAANYIGQDVYVILSYDLPLQKLIGDVVIAPYIMLEKSNIVDTAPYYNISTYQAGFNIKLTPSVVLKLEGTYSKPNSSILGSHMYRLFSQLAVAF
jgi:hypothetical protein